MYVVHTVGGTECAMKSIIFWGKPHTHARTKNGAQNLENHSPTAKGIVDSVSRVSGSVMLRPGGQWFVKRAKKGTV